MHTYIRKYIYEQGVQVLGEESAPVRSADDDGLYTTKETTRQPAWGVAHSGFCGYAGISRSKMGPCCCRSR